VVANDNLLETVNKIQIERLAAYSVSLSLDK